VILSALDIGSFFASHWNVVLVIGLAFFLLQIGLCGRFFLRMSRQARVLQRLYDNVQRGGKGRAEMNVSAAGFPWLRWVHQVFPAGETTPGNYTRDDVLQELDTRIASSPDYLLLQRMGVMAPLLGVILTVMGFWWLEVDSQEQTLGDILFAVTPLVVGVGTGAVLAFINQGLLHVAGIRAESVRMAARTWFDSAIWKSVGLDTQAATAKAAEGVEKMARSVSESAERQQETTQWLRDSTVAIQEGAVEFYSMIQQLGGEVQGLPAMLEGMRETMESSVETIQSLVPVAERVVAGLDVSVSAFRTAVESQFSEAARLHRAAIGDISDSAERLSRTTEHLKTGSEDLHGAIGDHASSFQELRHLLSHSLENDLVPTHQKLRAAVASFDSRVSELSACMRSLRDVAEGLSQNLDTATQGIGTFAGQLQPAVTAFKDAVDGQFTAAAHEHEKNLKTLAASVEQIHQAGGTLARASRAIEESLGQHAEFDRQIGPVQQNLLAATEKVAQAGDALTETTQSQLVPAQQTMSEAVDSLSGSAERLAAFVGDGLDPATQRLVALDETLARMQQTVSSLGDLGDARQQIERLSQSLAQAATVADAIAALPDQLRQVLEETALAQQEQESVTGPRGNPLGSLRGQA